jgi:nucleotide-binding universal stress UspA family protein
MRTILVGLDGSPRAPDVLAAARDLAVKTGARLVLFRAVSVPVGLPHEAYSVTPDGLEQLLLREARRELEILTSDLPRDLPARLRVEPGTPWRALCEAARTEDADLIVIGSHGYSGLDHLIGTTAAKVVNHARRSVLVVWAPRPEELEGRRK